MQIFVLIGFVITVVFLTDEVREVLLPPGPMTAAALAAYLIGTAVLARMGVRASLGILAGRTPSAARLRRHRLLTVAQRAWMLGGAAALLAGGTARWVMVDLALGTVPLLGTWLALLPFVAAVLVHWWVGYPSHVATRRQLAAVWAENGPPPATWTRRQYLLFHLRTSLLFVAAPLSGIILIRDVLTLYIGQRLAPIVMIVAVAGVFLTAPVLIVRIWRARRLEDGPLRERLEALCRRLKLRYREILVWPTSGVLANAGVMGLLPPVRYVLLTDALLERMNDRQIVGVFAHEAGHVIYHHLFYAALFAIATAGLAAEISAAAMLVFDLSGWASHLGMVALVAAGWAFGFGWLSRRFERQSDVTAARMLSRMLDANASADCLPDVNNVHADDRTVTPVGAAAYTDALQRVADLNGMPVNQHNWRHGSIAWRIQYVLRLLAFDPARHDIDRLVRRIKLGLWLALLAAIVVPAILAVFWEPIP
ncbi:MAG: M48 family metallopeptidase [Planctomycetota bacterium]|jgi:STE24 endopeptidase